MMAQGFWIRFVAGFLMLSATFAVASHAQEACKTYTVQPGDTLGAISITAYGRLDYQVLYNANAEALRSDPATPAPGTILRIPCEDGRISAEDDLPVITEAAADSPAEEPTPESAPSGSEIGSAYRPEISMVSGDDWRPFADPSLTGGGLFPRITATALDRAGPQYRHRIGWVEDWESHIFALLPTGAFDFAPGWYDPNCDNTANASERTLYVCDNFIFSDPLYDSTFGYFSKAGTPYAEARTFADLTGARVCRAEGNLFQDLEALGLVEPVITIHMEELEEDCVEGVLEDRYDVASFETQYAGEVWSVLGLTDEVVQSTSLTTIQTAVVFAHKSNPRALDYIAHVNRGLAILRASDEWSEIVTSTLAEAESLEATE